MTQDERWLTKYNEVKDFIVKISGYSAILLIVFMNLFLLKTLMIPLSLKLKSKAPAN